MAARRAPAHWTARENNLICKLRRKGLGLEEIAPRLPHCAPEAISAHIQVLLAQGRFERLREPIPAGAEWTDAEEALLIELRGKSFTAADMAEHFPGRTPNAIAMRVQRLVRLGRIPRRGPRSRKAWSDTEERRLRALLAQQKTRQEIATALRRTVESVNARIAWLKSKNED